MIGVNTQDRVRNMAFIALCTVLIAVCAWIYFPSSPIPYSMQNFGVFITIGILGGKKAFIAIAVYLALGAVGIPVFSGFTGGLGRLFGETGGFLFGFLIIALLSWFFTSVFKRGNIALLISLLLGQALSYLLGVCWYWFLYASTGGGSFLGIVAICVLPFLIPDIVKIFIAAALSYRVKKILKI